jgi:hypothetical protein
VVVDDPYGQKRELSEEEMNQLTGVHFWKQVFEWVVEGIYESPYRSFLSGSI